MKFKRWALRFLPQPQAAGPEEGAPQSRSAASTSSWSLSTRWYMADLDAGGSSSAPSAARLSSGCARRASQKARSAGGSVASPTLLSARYMRSSCEAAAPVERAWLAISALTRRLTSFFTDFFARATSTTRAMRRAPIARSSAITSSKLLR